MVDSGRSGLKPVTRLIIVLLIISPLALAVPALMEPGSNESDTPSPSPAPAPAPLAARDSDSRLKIEEIRPVAGFAINAHHISDLPLYLKSVDQIADLGANALVVLTPMIQTTVSSDGMAFVPEKCATDEQLIAIMQRARQRGLHTTLMPIVLIDRPGDKDWRGVIKPVDWDTWWVSYDAFIDRFVGVATKANVDLLCIGSELNSTEGQLDRWKRVAQRVRERFHGQLAYSANWDRYEKVKLWELVDVMCVSSYFELARDNPKADEAALVKAWRIEQKKLLDFSAAQHRPLLLSEVGYPSLPWASAHPWNYITGKDTPADHAAQARGWRAFFKAWNGTFTNPETPAFGFLGYAWSPYHHGDNWDVGYGIEGKPSYGIVKDGIARIRAGKQGNSTTQ